MLLRAATARAAAFRPQSIMAQTYMLKRSAPDYDDNAPAGHVVVTLLLAVLAIGAPVFAHPVSQVVGLALCVMFSLLVTRYAAPALPAVLIFAYFFQNTFVAVVTPLIGGGQAFDIIRAYSFVLTTTVWGLLFFSFAIRVANYDAITRQLMIVSTGVMALIAAYFVLGLGKDVISAIKYLRNIILPLMCFQICLLGCRAPPD